MKAPVPAVLLAIAFSLVCPEARGQPRLDAGTRELAIHISPDFEGAVGDMIFIDVGYGLFLRRGVELRATISFESLEDVAGEDSDYRARELSFVGEYHFRRDRKLVPYAGLGIGWRKTEFNQLEESAFVGGPVGGIKYFLADNVVLDLGATFKFSSADVFINDFEPESTDLSSMIGLRFLF